MRRRRMDAQPMTQALQAVGQLRQDGRGRDAVRGENEREEQSSGKGFAVGHRRRRPSESSSATVVMGRTAILIENRGACQMPAVASERVLDEGSGRAYDPCVPLPFPL